MRAARAAVAGRSTRRLIAIGNGQEEQAEEQAELWLVRTPGGFEVSSVGSRGGAGSSGSGPEVGALDQPKLAPSPR